MKLLQDRAGQQVEITLSDGSELEGVIGEVTSNSNGTAFELEVSEEYEDGSSEQSIYLINWNDMRFLKDISNEAN